MKEVVLLNVGCGAVFHPGWVNLDAVPAHPSVRRWDLRIGLPFRDGEVAVCYASHVLEHLPRQGAAGFLRECHRILKSGGVVRIVVPDLEAIARHYLRLLSEAESGSSAAAADYNWVLLELFDQMVRERSGGEMHAYLSSGKVKNPDFVIARAGIEAEQLIRDPRSSSLESPGGWSFSRKWRRVREEIAGSLAAAVLGSEGRRALKEGLFRRSGQVHLWMYDRYSLRGLLEDCGFVEVKRCESTESRIRDFVGYQLDVVAGRTRKPDSLFMEASKP